MLCFYHGEHELSPLHEGSLVTRGVKHIVRSDVLYMRTNPKPIPNPNPNPNPNLYPYPCPHWICCADPNPNPSP